MRTRYLEDFTPGETFRTAGVAFDEAGIVEFARRYDPQSIHIDAAAAAKGPFEGLIASGFHTTSSLFRAWIDLGFLDQSSLGGPGIDEIRWLVPVRPGDTITAEVEILEARPSQSRPDRGILRYRMRGYNQRDELVISSINVSFLRRGRPEQ